MRFDGLDDLLERDGFPNHSDGAHFAMDVEGVRHRRQENDRRVREGWVVDAIRRSSARSYAELNLHGSADSRADLFYPTTPPESQMLTVAKDAHNFFAALGQVPWRPVVIGAQEQASRFLASDGFITSVPTPAGYWEVPGVLPDGLSYIR